MWLKADTGVLNGSGVAASDGNTIGTWQDQSGAGNHVTQKTDAQRPTYKTNIKNSLPVVRFTANGALVKALIGWAFTNRTVFIVYSDAVGSGVRIIAGVNGANWYTGVSGTSTIQSWQNNAATQRTLVSSAVATAGTFQVASYRQTSSGANYTALDRLNGFPSSSPQTDTLRSGLSATDFLIGGFTPTGGSNNLDGDIAEVLVYDSSLSDANVLLVEDYLRSKWNVVNLLQQSENFAAVWGHNNLTITGGETDPDGGTTASKLFIPASLNTNLAQPVTAVAARYTCSVYVKAGNTSTANFGLHDGTSFYTVTPSIISGSGSISGTSVVGITGLDSGWTRIQFTTNANVVAGATIRFFIYPQTSGIGTANNYIYATRAQLEQATSASTYQKT